MGSRTSAALVIRRRRYDDRISSRREGVVERADVELGPAVVVGEEDVGCGCKHRVGEQVCETHGG